MCLIAFAYLCVFFNHKIFIYSVQLFKLKYIVSDNPKQVSNVQQSDCFIYIIYIYTYIYMYIAVYIIIVNFMDQNFVGVKGLV